MCDYSLHSVRSRPGKVGDKLVTTGFFGTQSRGFAAPEEPNVAVCLLPGTELAFHNKVKHDGLFWPRSTGEKTAIFRQVNAQIPGVHHDALEFPDGRIVLVTHLRKGQHAAVLQLPAQPAPPDPREKLGELFESTPSNEVVTG